MDGDFAIDVTTYAIGIDLGGTRVKAVAVTPDGETLFSENIAFEVEEKMDWAKRIGEIVQRIQRECGALADSIGLAAPGLAAADGHSIAHMPGRLGGLEGLNWTRFLEAGRPVPVLNDAQAALLGENWIGAAQGFENVILLTLGTGVGGAAMVDGKLLRGRIGRAGHLGHICLNPEAPPDVCGTPGSLERAIGNCTIAERTRGAFQSTHDLVTAHLAGDGFATEVWLKSVKDLACAICSFINILDPEAVIIGGGIARAGPALFQPLQRFLDPIEWRPGGHKAMILPARLGELAGSYGAARQSINETPGSERGGETIEI